MTSAKMLADPTLDLNRTPLGVEIRARVASRWLPYGPA